MRSLFIFITGRKLALVKAAWQHGGRMERLVGTSPSVCSIWQVVGANLEAGAMLLGPRRVCVIFEGSFGRHRRVASSMLCSLVLFG